MSTTTSEIAISINATRLQSDANGFARLGRLHQEAQAYSNATIHIDMSKLAWMDGHLASAMLIIVRRAQQQGNTLFAANTKPQVKDLLQRNGLYKTNSPTRHSRTVMPVKEFIKGEAVEFSQYARQHLSRREMPKMTEALENKFFEGIDELFANSELHSRATLPFVVCGQFYPRREILDFSIVDGGRSIAGSLRESGIMERQRSDADAISWAMEPGSTTRVGNIPGGLGLKVLRDFVRLNKGKLIIVSGGGFWMQIGDKVLIESMPHSFPGTTVILEINTNDRNSYDLVGGPKPSEIW